MLALPYAFSKAGIVGGALYMSFISVVAMIGMNFLLSANHHLCRVENKLRLDYGELCELAFKNGPVPFLQEKAHWGKMCINVLLVFTQMGFCAIYFVFIAESVEVIIQDFGAEEVFNVRLMITIFLVPIVFLCMIRNLGKLQLCYNMVCYIAITSLLIKMFMQGVNQINATCFANFNFLKCLQVPLSIFKRSFWRDILVKMNFLRGPSEARMPYWSPFGGMSNCVFDFFIFAENKTSLQNFFVTP